MTRFPSWYFRGGAGFSVLQQGGPSTQEHGQLPAASDSLPRGRREPPSVALLTGGFPVGSVLSRATPPPREGVSRRVCGCLLCQWPREEASPPQRRPPVQSEA